MKLFTLSLNLYDMPTILRKLGFRFHFFSKENNEPPHVHVNKGKGRGKYWLEPVKKEYMKNFTKQDEKRADKIVREEQDNFKSKWYDFFGGK